MNRLLDRVRKMCENHYDLGFEGVILMDSSCQVLYEKRWTEDYPRDIYSNTKSFVGAAAGMAIYQNKLSLNTRLVDMLWPSCEVRGGINEIKLFDLLTMRSGFAEAYLMYFDRRRGTGAEDYYDYMFKQQLQYKPGTHYLYSSGDAILVGGMVEKAVGMTLHHFLYQNMFKQLGIDYPIWECDLMGHSCGGSGLQLKLKDMAKLGCLYLSGGYLNGIRFFSEDWPELSFTKYVSLNNKEYEESYGFLWKICYDGKIYKAHGAFGQDTLIFPYENVVLGYQCKEGSNIDRIDNVIVHELLCQ